MNNDQLVSINITTYNRGHILSRCIDSILNQSYQNIEIVIVDDCSTDNTTEIIKSYQKKYDYIKYYKNGINKGNAYSRNVALENCNGFYIAFMDDDDQWIDNDKLKKQITIFENSKNDKLAIVCSGIMRYLEDGMKLEEKAYHPKNIQDIILRGGLIHNSTVLIKKSVIDIVGKFDLNVGRGVDSEFFRRIIIVHNYEVFFMEDITCMYYEDCPNRMTVSKNCKGYLKHLNSQYVNIKKYFKYLLPKPLILFLRIKIMIFLSLQYIKCKATNGK